MKLAHRSLDAAADALLAFAGRETEDEDDPVVGAFLLAEALLQYLGWRSTQS